MTFEHKLICGLEEIKALVFECNECKARAVIPAEDVKKPPKQCPKGHTWEWDVPEEYETVQGSAFMFFLQSLRRLREPASKRANGFTLFLEFEDPRT